MTDTYIPRRRARVYFKRSFPVLTVGGDTRLVLLGAGIPRPVVLAQPYAGKREARQVGLTYLDDQWRMICCSLGQGSELG
jgi:hypothetical protein